MSEARGPQFQVGDKVVVQPGLRERIRRGEVSDTFTYVDRTMDPYAQKGIVLTITDVLHRAIHGRNGYIYGYKTKECKHFYTYNEAWLMPLYETNEAASALLRDTL